MQLNKEYESEISLRDLFFHVIYRWRSIIAAMIIVAILAGGYVYLKNRSAAGKKEETIVEDNLAANDASSLIDNYNSSNEIYQRLLQENQDYYQNSVIMKTDPYHVWKATTVYSITVDDTGETDPLYFNDIANIIANSYSVLIFDHLDIDSLQRIYDLPYPGFVNELITIQITSGNNQNTANETGTILLKVSTTGLNEDQCTQAMNSIEKTITEVTKGEVQALGKHHISRISRSVIQTIDTNLESKQAQVAKNIATYQNAITTNNTAVSKAPASTEAKAKKLSLKKYVLIGALLGFFILVCFYIARYLLSGKMTDASALTEQYSVPLYGEFFSSRAHHPGKGLDGLIEKWEKGGHLTDPEIIYGNICALIKDRGEDQQIVLTGTLTGEYFKDVFTNLTKRLGDTVSLTMEEQYTLNEQAIIAAGKAASVILVEKKGVSDLEQFHDMADKLMISNANVIGAIIL